MDVAHLISAGMKFRNKEKFRYGIPAYTGPFRVLVLSKNFPGRTKETHETSVSRLGIEPGTPV
jgi:hypothetical protein